MIFRTSRARILCGLAVGAFLLAIASVLYKLTDNYYILDVPKKRIIYHFQVHTRIEETPFAGFDTIVGFSVSARPGGRVDRPEHAVVAGLKNGRIFPVSDFATDCFDDRMVAAKLMAQATGTRFFEGEAGKVIVMRKPSPAEGLAMIPVSEEGWGLTLRKALGALIWGVLGVRFFLVAILGIPSFFVPTYTILGGIICYLFLHHVSRTGTPGGF